MVHISVVMVPKFQYPVQIPVKIGTNFGTKAKRNNLLIKKKLIWLIKLNKNKLYKNKWHSIFLFEIVSSFSISNKSMKTSFTQKLPLKDIGKLSVLGFSELFHDRPAAGTGKYSILQ